MNFKYNDLFCIFIQKFPDEIIRIIYKHVNAQIIQNNFLNWSLQKHTQRKEWKRVHDRIGLQMTQSLSLYTNVRKEWRSELHLWMDISHCTLKTIENEAYNENLWGSKTHRLDYMY